MKRNQAELELATLAMEKIRTRQASPEREDQGLHCFLGQVMTVIVDAQFKQNPGYLLECMSKVYRNITGKNVSIKQPSPALLTLTTLGVRDLTDTEIVGLGKAMQNL